MVRKLVKHLLNCNKYDMSPNIYCIYVLLITVPCKCPALRLFVRPYIALNLAFKFLIYPKRYRVHIWYTYSSDPVLPHWRNIYYLDMCHDRCDVALRRVVFLSSWYRFCVYNGIHFICLYIYMSVYLYVETLSSFTEWYAAQSRRMYLKIK